MSFNSNYLKLRAEREGSSANHAGGSAPPATSQEQPTGSGANSYTSSYLALREKRNNMTISERAEAKAQALLKKQQEQARTPAGILSNYGRNHSGPTTSGGYYSRPELGSYSERLHGNITALEPVLTEKRAALDTAQTSLVQAETDLKTVQGYLQQARAVYDADPTNENATSYNQIVGAYNLAYDAYASAFKTYSTAYDAYKPYEDQLIDALAIYQLYSNQQQAAFDDWRGTIRDADTIQTEITAIDQQMADLEAAEADAAEAARQQQLAEYQARQDAKPWYEKLLGYLGGVQDTTLPLAGVTPGTVEAAFNQPEKNPSREMQQLIAMKELLQEELNWSQYYYYADFAGAPDFAEMSKYVPQEEKEQRALDIMLDNYSSDAAPWEDPLYEYINGNEEAGAWLSNAGANYYGPDNAIGAFFGRATENKAESQQMTEQEVATFNYLYATKGKAAAHAYYDYLLADLNYRQRKSEEEYWANYAAQGPVGSSVFSVVMSPMKGLSYIGQLTDYLHDGAIDQNAAYNKFSYVPSSIRAQVVQQIEASGKWGKVGSFAYQTGLSMADFLLNAAIAGGNETATLAIMGTGAAADATIAAKDRGLNDDQAFLLGTIAGAAEVITEKVSLETLLNPDLLKNGAGKYVLKNMLAEGSEEVGSDLINLIADILISKDQSEWNQSVNKYIADGKTEEEAFGLAIAEQAATMGLDFLGGAISGGLMSGVNAGIHVNYTGQMGSELGELNLDAEDIQAFIETGLESDPETASYQLASEMQAKIEAGKTLSNYDLARLYQANAMAIQDEESSEESGMQSTVTEDNQDGDGTKDGSYDLEGLRLRAVDDAVNPGSVTENAGNVAQNQENGPLENNNAPLSVAERLRQEQEQNGGTQYERTYERAAGPAVAQPAGELYVTGGANLSDGGAERNVGTGTGEQVRSLASSPEQRRVAYADRSRATVARQNYARSLRLEKVSSLDLGLQNGTEARNIQVMPQEHWDAEMSQLADRIYKETGKSVTYVMGRIQIRGTGGAVGYARGVITGDRIIVQADHLRIPMEQIADHEAYHAKVDFTDGRLNDEIRRHIVETFSEEQLQQVLDKYIEGMRGVIDVNDARTGEEFETAMRQIEEEIFADAYSGINAFGAHADQFTDAVNEKMDQLYMGKIRNQDNGVRETGAPPSDRYSYAGENANNADIDALARAKEMRSAGVADETIRQQTGWHTGMDGKWRWEIDDSKMQYTSRGDLGLRERRPEYARYRELLDKSNRYVLELSDEALTPEETTELQKLKDIWGGTFRKAGRITEDALPTDLLSDYVKHDDLFEAYPQLRKTRLRFADLPEGTRGQYDPEQDVITLSESLRGKPQDTLIHEIQHVIQKAEGFAQGSSPEFWDGQQVASPEYASEIQKAEDTVKKVEAEFHQEWPDDINLNLVKRYIELDNQLWGDGTDPIALQELADQMDQIEQLATESGWGDLFNDYYYAVGQLQMAKERAKLHRRASIDLYRNTAGEIEARDAASRRQLTAEQRRGREPARADDRTVFVEGVDEMALAEMDAEYGPQMQHYFDPHISDEEIGGNIQAIAQMNPVAQITGEEFAKGEKDLITQVENFFSQLGNSTYNEQLGDVVLDRRGIKSDIAHGIGRKKAAAFAAVPDVISQGLIVDYQQNWKDRGYDTAVVAAPITIGTEDHIVAVILTRSNQTNRFYVHEVLTTKNGAMPFKTGAQKKGAPGGDAPSVFSILDKIRSVKNGSTSKEKFSVDDVDSHGHSLTPEQQEFYAQSQARDSYGRLLVLYHQTDGDFTIFDTRHPGAGSRDSDTPFGIFLKHTAGDIGLAGKKQMALYANITNPLRAANREDLARQLREISGSYAAISDKHKQLDAEYHEKFEQAKKAWRDYIIEWRAANPDANRSALNDDPKFNELFDAEDTILDEWTAAADLLSTQAKEAITQDLRAAGYDGVFLENDVGSWGRRTDAIIALDPQQVKNISNKTPTINPDIRYSLDDSGPDPAQQQTVAPKKKIRPVAESRPLIAKKDLRSTVLNLFSIPNGQRTEIGTMIDSYADRLIKNGSLTEEDRKAFFDRMYDAGVMVMPAEEYSAFARSHIVDGRIYVSDSVKADFGDDWADIRRRAFAAGVYLVNDRSASGIDQWNATLSAEDMLPGLFDSEETDERTILERIIQVAEEGKDEHLSLAEYTRRLSQQEGISEDEFLDNMERQLDWALRTFAEKARLEVHLRDRTGRKIAQEREKGDERMTRQQAKEAQRRADERQARKDSARRAKERRELRELQQRTLKQLQWLSKNRFRAPEELQATWDEVLGDIDIYAVSAADEMRWSDKHNATWKDLVEMYDKAKAEDPNFFESKELERFVARLRYKKLEDLDIDALDALYKLATGLRTKFYNQKNVVNDEMQRLFAEVYTDAKREIESAPGENSAKKGKVSGWADKLLNLDQLTPMNVLQRMAGWDPDGAFYSMAKQLERGERDMRAYSVKAQKMLQDFLTEHEDWVKKADGQGKDGLWYKIEIPELVVLELGKTPKFGDTIEVWMTPMQKIHMYLESKNQDNLRHMTGGRTFADKQLYSEGKRKEAFAQGKTVRMAPETVKAIVKDLTAEEMELAQILDRYYNTFANQEINKVSNILYGYDKAMGKNYAPIYTNQNYTKTEFGVFDTTAEGVGNLKGRQYAVNPSYNISAFDAFERHVDQTARFCGMAIPARNWTTLMNWREKNNSTGDVITHKWGEESKRYITDLITTLQAGDDAKNDTVSSGIEKLKSNYISAVFGANPSIVLKQLGSIPLASAYLDFKNFPSVSQIRSIDRSLISKYTQDLEWRTMGYSMPETKYLKDNPNWTKSNKVFGFVFGGDAITAMDGWAASTLWPWAENKVRREHPELAVGTKAQVEAGESAFYKKVAEEFENAVARSQSTSDEIHQGTLRKSKNPFTRAFTMFRSDSAQTYNAIRQKIGEAQYYARTGNDQKALRAAKRAVGSAFMSAVVGYMWAEGIEFLMNLWKHKGKKYRDDDDELTAQSVMGEMVSGLVGDMAGIVVGGEELYDFIGGVLTDGTWFGIDTMGMEQLNDCLGALREAAVGVRDVIIDAKDIMENGGDIGDYFRRHGNEMLGGIKDLAKAVTTYFPGLPANNVEAYLIGAVKWISPELGTAYDDLFSDIGKNDLSGLEGDALTSRIGRILEDRKASESEDTAKALASLYEGGYKTAIPSDTPTSISINGEKQTLGAYQQQAYETIWGGIVADALDDMVASDSFAEANPKTQEKMLSNLYTYAAEQAKAELFDEYELDSGAANNAAIVAAGATVAECITWNTITSEMKSGEKSAELASWDIPESAKREIFRCKISDSREDSIAAIDEAGLSFDQFLQAYSMYGQINNEDLKAGMKAVEFSHWVNAQGYTAEQAAVVKDELTYFNMTPASSSRYDELVGAGMDPDEAYDLTGALNELQPADGEDEVSDLQKWRASVDFSDDVDDQLAALSAVMTDAQFLKVEIANNFGVSPDAYVTLQEIKPQYDADGNGSYKNAEIKAAVDGLPGYYTTEQKAVLWQLATGSTSARNNPYSRQVGQQVLDARAAAKEVAAQEQTEAPTDSTDDDSFSQALLDQLLGRG